MVSFFFAGAFWLSDPGHLTLHHLPKFAVAARDQVKVGPVFGYRATFEEDNTIGLSDG